MAVFLPILHSRCASWVKDDSLDSYLLVTKVFKIFRALIQVIISYSNLANNQCHARDILLCLKIAID